MRLLIVSPNFTPVNAPDMHRVRIALPELVRRGWEITVLCADDPTPLAPVEDALALTLPGEVRVERCACASRRWTASIGINNVGWRSLWGMWRRGARLIRAVRPDVILFSTTQVIVLPLGVLWRNRFGIPFVVDLQDPWAVGSVDAIDTPGAVGKCKARLARRMSEAFEGRTLAAASHLVTVSAKYVERLADRYPWWDRSNSTVLPFGASPDDFDVARRLAPAAVSTMRRPGGQLAVHVGRLGSDMRPALRVLFQAMRILAGQGAPLDAHFIGTSYAPAGQGRPTTPDLARASGVADFVHETTGRVGMFDSLRALLESDIVLVIGSDDPGYSPSKLYPAILSEREVVVVAPRDSVLHEVSARFAGVHVAAFDPNRSGADDGDARALAAVLAGIKASGSLGAGPRRRAAALPTEALASGMASRLAAVLESVVTDDVRHRIGPTHPRVSAA